VLEDFVKRAENNQDLIEEFLFGDLSVFGSALQNIQIDDSSASQLLRLLHVSATNQSESTNVEFVLSKAMFTTVHKRHRPEICSRLNGLKSAISAYNKWICGERQLTKQIQENIDFAIDMLNKAWPERNANAPSQVASETIDSRINSDPVNSLFSHISPTDIRFQSRGFFVVMDFLRSFDPRPVLHSASTPIAVRASSQAGTEGYILWLTVELESSARSIFCPDLTTFGLTALNALESENLDETFLYSMDKAWRISRVGERGFRGRWRLQHRCPLEANDNAKASHLRWSQSDTKIAYFPCIWGPSAEAAALAAILAASGMIQYADHEYHLGFQKDPNGNLISDQNGKQCYKPLQLVPSVVVTAKLSDAKANHITDIKLEGVGGIDAKLSAADRYRLDDADDAECLIDLMVISKENSTDEEIKKRIVEAEAKKSPTSQSFNKVRIAQVETVEQMFHHMLVVNRWMDALHRRTEKLWLEGDGTRLSGWDYLRDTNGNLVDEDGNIIQGQRPELNTGSIEHMRVVSERLKKLNESGSQTARASDEDDEDDEEE
jgi:hypothetical protein